MACQAHQCRPWARLRGSFAPTWSGSDQGGLTSKKYNGRGPPESREASLVPLLQRDGHLNPKIGAQQV